MRKSVAGTFGAGAGRQPAEPTRHRILRLLVRRRVHLQVTDAREVSGHHSGGVHGGAIAQKRHHDDENHQSCTQFSEIHVPRLWLAVACRVKARCSMICLREIAVQRTEQRNEGKVFDEMSERKRS